MSSLNYSDKMEEVTKDITSVESILGNGLRQPFNGANSGNRKLMFNTHLSHRFPLLNPEKAIIETGYEIRFGDYSSSIIKADSDYKVIAKISKFSFIPNHHYWLILQDMRSNKLDVIERISYEHISEGYGYLYNNEYLDGLNLGDYIPKDTICCKSLAFDAYNNRQDGMNLNCAYMALDDNMEDSIVFSDPAADKMTSPLINIVERMINDNDIPLNLYGDDTIYKIFPDIMEDVKDGSLIYLRKEKKEEAFFAQSIDRLRTTMISDDPCQIVGKVIDIEVFCNKPEILDKHHFAQLKMYYNELLRMSSELIKVILPYKAEKFELSHELRILFGNAKRVCNHDLYINKRPFSGIMLRLVVMEPLGMSEGDKAGNRYGGKGVISAKWPLEMMPRYKNIYGEWEYIDVIFNSSTMYGRENVGQIFELSLTHIGTEILKRIITEQCSLEEAYEMINTYTSLCSGELANYRDEIAKSMTREELAFHIESIINSGAIHLSMKPISEAMDIDKINELYKHFPWIEQTEIEVPMISSDGSIRYVKARRRIVVGKQYIYRLKQFAEEKFSATSLSATNIRNENVKSRDKKDFKEIIPNTPIKFGNMEIGNMNHLGAEVVIQNMMIHSVSPQGRRLVEQMYDGDPFEIDIKLDSDSKNRSAEIVNTYLKAIGRGIRFIKIRKNRMKVFSISPITFEKEPYITPITFVPESEREKYDYEAEFQKRQKMYEQYGDSIVSPINFDGIMRNKNGERSR